MTSLISRRPAGPETPLPLRGRLALIAGKVAARATRVVGRGGGTAITGMVARKVDPRILDELVRIPGVPVVAITGSNGKTTTARFTAALLRGEGVTVCHNSAGANLVQGVISLAVSYADLHGRLPEGVLVAEVDEGALPEVAPETLPRALLVTDLFRDQLDRFGEIYAVADAIQSVAAALPADAALVVNADDPMVATLAEKREGRRVTFGLDIKRSTDQITRAADTIRCPRCQADLKYRHVYLSHLGDYACTGCGFARPKLDVAVTALEVVGLDRTRFDVQTPTGGLTVEIPQSGVHIAYDAAGAIAIMVGLGLSLEHAAESLASVGPAFGRLEKIDADGRTVILAFAKNPTSYNTTLRSLATEGEPRQLLIAASNTLVDGEDFGWLWDVDFESMAPKVVRAVVSGTRADELANRLYYAGVSADKLKVVEDRREALTEALTGLLPGGRLVVLSGYTPLIELRDEMRRRGWTGRYWAV
ncbi:MAG TPA: MurT ligase domain-containing protein [Candidatus Limnocylindrales bacterium]|jgi:UDP-N-acetylmuramyl tripeptide synthase